MSEAQYVCTGQVDERALSHYGLGLEKYTHFTSPIRRYADVVVHKQLLESGLDSSGGTTSSIESRILPSLVPESSTISILGGEGIIQGQMERGAEAVDFSINPKTKSETKDIERIAGRSKVETKENKSTRYIPREVTRICSILNRQNRMAKVRALKFSCQAIIFVQS